MNQLDAHLRDPAEANEPGSSRVGARLRRLGSEQDTFEIRPIIKALVDADWLADLDSKLEHYRAHAEPIA